jgi:hypothetical protein
MNHDSVSDLLDYDADAKVEVTVRIPEQFFTFTYPKKYWDWAVEDGEVADLMDMDVSDIYVEKEVFGPDGQRVS